MATTLLFRRGDTATSNAFTGGEGELFVDTQKDTIVVHDGVTAGGHPLATETYVDNAVTTIIDSAPGALDTLNELAAALGDDANFATTVTNSLALKLDTADFNSTLDSYVTGGTGVTVSGGEISIGQPVGTTDNVTFAAFTAQSVTYKFNGTPIAETYAEEVDTTSTTTVEIASYLVSKSRTAKVIIQAYDSDSIEVHVSEILVTFDGTNALATEYATIFSGTAELFTALVTYDSGTGGVIVEATPASTNATNFKTLVMTLGA